MQAKWEGMTLPQQQKQQQQHASRVGGHDPPTAAKEAAAAACKQSGRAGPSHSSKSSSSSISSVQAEWEGMTLPQQQKPSPITIYQIQPIDIQIGVVLDNCEQELNIFNMHFTLTAACMLSPSFWSPSLKQIVSTGRKCNGLLPPPHAACSHTGRPRPFLGSITFVPMGSFSLSSSLKSPLSLLLG